MKIKSILIMVCTTVISLVVACPAFAINKSEDINKTINEYQMLKELSECSASELNAIGFNSIEIAEIKDYKNSYRNHIEEIKQLDEDVLRKHGYTDNQIEVIKNFKGTDEEMMLASAEISLLDGEISSLYYDGDYTRGTLNYEWEWSGVPNFKWTDVIGVAWNGWVCTGDTCAVRYYSVTTGNYYTTRSGTFEEDKDNPAGGAGHSFDVEISDNLYYAKTGSGTFIIKSDTHSEKDFYGTIEYGHAQMFVSISLGFGWGGVSGSIEFPSGVLTVATDSVNGIL